MGEPDKRVRGIADLPMESLRCSAAGRHVGFWLNDPTMKKVGGWGRLNSWEVPLAVRVRPLEDRSHRP